MIKKRPIAARDRGSKILRPLEKSIRICYCGPSKILQGGKHEENRCSVHVRCVCDGPRDRTLCRRPRESRAECETRQRDLPPQSPCRNHENRLRNLPSWLERGRNPCEVLQLPWCGRQGPQVQDAFHKSCQGCHKKENEANKKKAPVKCTQCHVKA